MEWEYEAAQSEMVGGAGATVAVVDAGWRGRPGLCPGGTCGPATSSDEGGGALASIG